LRNLLLHQEIDARRWLWLLEKVDEERPRQVVGNVACDPIWRWQQLPDRRAQDIALDDAHIGTIAERQTQGPNAGGVDLDACHRSCAARQLHGQGAETRTDLDDVVGRRELEGFDDPLELLPVGEEILSPAPLIPDAEAAGDAADYGRVGEIQRSLASRRGSTERDRWHFARSP
jgi:hypothetical protein